MANTTLDVKIQIRNDTKNNWTTQNPVLLKGEMGVETDTRKFKFGDGVSDWTTLEYASATGAIIMNKAPTPTDSGYDVGAMWIDTAGNKAYVLFNNTSNNAIWKQMVTPDDLSDLGAGDMLKSQFANNPKAEQGYVNAAIMADTATNATTADKVAHKLTAGSKEFDGSADIEITAADLNTITIDEFQELSGNFVTKEDIATDTTLGIVKSSAKGTDTVTVNPSTGVMTMGKASVAAQADTAAALQTGRTIALSGDATGTSPAFDGSANVAIPVVLAKSGVTAGIFTKVTVNDKGLVTSGEALVASDIPSLTLSKITDAGTAAAADTGIAEGNVPVLGVGGKLNEAVIPAIAITDTYVVDSQAAMLGLEAQKGDVAVRTDVNKTFILKQSPASTIGNWVELETPTDAVTSVNGLTGAVVLTTSNIEEGSNLYFTTARANANWVTHASTELTDSDTLLRTTDTFILNGGNA